MNEISDSNEKTPELSEKDLNNLANELQKESPNKNLLKEIVQSTNLSPEEIKQTFPNLEKEWKNDRVEPVKTATDQEKISDYDRLNVKDLPSDWKLQLARLKHLESELSNYTKTKEELKGWTDTFSSKRPVELEDEFQRLETELDKTKNELNAKISELETQLSAANSEKTQIVQNLEEKVKQIQAELKEWQDFFNQRELSEVKSEWEVLQKRPDIPITENEFYDDYARRKSIQQNEVESKEIESLKVQLTEKDKQINSFQQKLNKILENGINQKYISAAPAITKEQAQEAIEELLTKTEKEWGEYLKTGGGARELATTLEFYPQKRSLAEQVLEWIKEAQKTHDYQKLFENWSGSSYDKEKDLDGSLFLLEKRLRVYLAE